MTKTLIALSVGAALVASGCSTTPSQADLARDMVAAQKIRDEAAAQQRAKLQATLESEVSSIPAWALQAPPPDAEGVYAVGMGSSDSLRLSIRKATLDAEFGLARTLNNIVSGSERSYSNEADQHTGHEEFRQLIDSLVARTSIVGTQVLKQATKPVNGKYSTTILLKMPYRDLNRVLQEQQSEVQDQKVKSAFAELYERLDKMEAKAVRPKDGLKPDDAPSDLNKGLSGNGEPIQDSEIIKKDAEKSL